MSPADAPLDVETLRSTARTLGWEHLRASYGDTGLLQIPAPLADRLAERAGGTREGWGELLREHEVFLVTSPEGVAVAGWREGNERVVALASAQRDLRRRAEAGDLAAGVSHDLSNALSAVLGWAELLARDEPTTDRDEAVLSLAVAARGAKEMAAQLLSVARGGTDEVGYTDVAEVLRRVRSLAMPLARARQVALELTAPHPIWAAVSPTPLFRAVWNLVLNALQILPAGGTVRVSAEATEEHATLVVADDGPGMDEATRAHVFDAYFSRRAGGTGLGLALVSETVRAAGGRVELESAPGTGARFSLVFPLAVERHTPTPRAAEEASGAIRLPSGVLVVEDDDTVRELVRTLLELREVTVHTAASMAEALTFEGPAEVALVDLTLRDGRGEELLATLRQERPELALIAMTGVAELPPMARENCDGWLRKPFEPRELLEAVLRARLGRAPSSRTA